MTFPYKLGQTYIWQNQVGKMAYLNGTECTVLEPPKVHWCGIKRRDVSGQLVDTPADVGYFFAEPGDLRPKDPPKGERTVFDLFKQPVLEPA